MINQLKTHRENLQSIFTKTLDLNLSSKIVANFSTNLVGINKNIHIVAIGKSAPEMLEGAISKLGRMLSNTLLITKDRINLKLNLELLADQIMLAGHPIPDENSFYAGECLIQFCQKIKTDDHILFLISGGTSSLVEYIPESIQELISIDDYIKLNKWLLASDKNIMDVNSIRKKISGIKAGRLLDYIKCKNISAFYISDVPDDNLKHIGSGLLIPDEITEDINDVPNWVTAILTAAKKILAPNNIDNIVDTHIIFSNSLFRKSLSEVAKSKGYIVHNINSFISGNTFNEASKIGDWLKTQKNGIYIWGAETHMQLPDSPGRGGRNQSFALALAKQIQNTSNIVVLVAGTDGNDGNTNDAGAIIDGQTINRGIHAGISVSDCLEKANAGEFLSASDDLLTIGATGTNVMDIIIALVWD